MRDAWIRNIAKYRADQLVFLDESGINTNMGQRTHGWGEKGKKIVHKANLTRSPNISLLPAMAITGYFACATFQGSVDADTFLDFIENEVIPRCNAFPLPRSVLIMDNASIHHAYGEVMKYHAFINY